MGDIQISFEHWYLAIPDSDESLLDDKKDGGYQNEDVQLMWVCFRAGYGCAE